MYNLCIFCLGHYVHKVTFKMDKTFNRSYERDDTVHHSQHHCNRVSDYSFECDTTYKDWALNTRYIFNGNIVSEHKTNKNKNVKTIKTYQRISMLPDEAIKEIKEGMTNIKYNGEVKKEVIESRISAWE